MLLLLLSFAFVLEISPVFSSSSLIVIPPPQCLCSTHPSATRILAQGTLAPRSRRPLKVLTRITTEKDKVRTKWTFLGFSLYLQAAYWTVGPGQGRPPDFGTWVTWQYVLILYLQSSDLHIMSQFWFYGNTRSNWQMIALFELVERIWDWFLDKRCPLSVHVDSGDGPYVGLPWGDQTGTNTTTQHGNFNMCDTVLWHLRNCLPGPRKNCFVRYNGLLIRITTQRLVTSPSSTCKTWLKKNSFKPCHTNGINILFLIILKSTFAVRFFSPGPHTVSQSPQSPQDEKRLEEINEMLLSLREISQKMFIFRIVS